MGWRGRNSKKLHILRSGSRKAETIATKETKPRIETSTTKELANPRRHIRSHTNHSFRKVEFHLSETITKKRDVGVIPYGFGQSWLWGSRRRMCLWYVHVPHVQRKNCRRTVGRNPITKRRLGLCNQERKKYWQSKAMKTNPFGAPSATNTSLKQEPLGHIQPRGKGGNQSNAYQNSQKGRGNLRGQNNFSRANYNPRGNKTNR